jgi:hypothetical protein
LTLPPKPPQSDKPPFQFRGVWTPPEVFLLLDRGLINTTEVVLLSIIDTMVNPEGDGCYATASSLARYVKCTVRHTKRMIRKLKRMKLLQDVGDKKVHGRIHRIIETAWSRSLPYDIYAPRRVPSMSPRLKNVDFKSKSLRAEPAEGLGTMFFNGASNNGKLSNKTGRIHVQLAIQLDKALRSIGRIKRRRTKTEADQIRLALEDDTARTAQEMQAVMDWLEENPVFVRSLYTLTDARRFRKIYGIILDKFRKQARTTVQVTDATKELTAQLAMKGWPKGSKAQLPQAVQLTYDSFSAFLKKLRAYAKADPKDRLADTLSSPGFLSATGLTKWWFESVHSSVANWQQWSGNLLSMAWDGDLDNSRFQTWGKDKAYQFSGSDTAFRKLLEGLR